MAFGAGALTAYLSASSDVNAIAEACRLRNGCLASEARQALDESWVSTKETLATVGLTLSAVSAATAVTLFFVEAGSEADANARVAVGAGPRSVSIRGRF